MRFDREKRELQPSDPLRGVPHYFYHELEPAAAPQNLARAVRVNAAAAYFIPKRILGLAFFSSASHTAVYIGAGDAGGICSFYIVKSTFREILRCNGDSSVINSARGSSDSSSAKKGGGGEKITFESLRCKLDTTR